MFELSFNILFIFFQQLFCAYVIFLGEINFIQLFTRAQILGGKSY